MAEERTGKPTLDELNAKLAGRIVIDPASIVGDTASASGGGGADSGPGEPGRNKDGSVKRKPGRKPGSGGTSKAKVSSSVGLEKILYSLHMVASKWIPEMELEHKESQALADAINDVQQFYGYEASAEVLLWTNVIGVMGGVYGPRIAAFSLNRKMRKLQSAPRKEEPLKPAPQNATPFVNLEGVDLAHHAPDE